MKMKLYTISIQWWIIYLIYIISRGKNLQIIADLVFIDKHKNVKDELQAYEIKT